MHFDTKKLLIIIFIILICVILVIVFFLSGKIVDKNDNIVVGYPEITVLETASSVSTNPPSYVPEFSFYMGQTIWIYQEYTNISHNGVSNFYINISVIHEDGNTLSFFEEHVNNDEKNSFYYFITNSTSWPDGLYVVSSKLVDYISDETTVRSTTFYLL